MLTRDIGIHIDIRDISDIEHTGKATHRIGKQGSNQHSVYLFFIKEIAYNHIKGTIIVLIKKELGYIDIIKFRLGSGFIYPFGNGFPILSRLKRGSDSNKMILFLGSKRTCHQIGLVVCLFKDSLYFFLILFGYTPTIVDHPIYRTNRYPCHFGNVYNTNI